MHPITVVFAFLGARLGGSVGAWIGLKSVRQSRREEWGRRFAAAVSMFAESDDHRSAIGRSMLLSLLESNFATVDDQDFVRALLHADATADSPTINDLPAFRREGDGTVLVVDDEVGRSADGGGQQ